MADSTLKPSGGDFSTLASALSDAGTSAGDTITISGDWSTRDTASGAVVADNNITVKTLAADQAEHAGLDNGGSNYALEVTSGHALQQNNTGLVLEGFIIKQDGTGDSDEGIRFNIASGTLTCKRMIIWADTQDSSQDGIYIGNQDATINLEQTYIFGFWRAGVHAQNFSTPNTDYTLNINSCGFWDNGASTSSSDNESGGGIKVVRRAGGTKVVNCHNTWACENDSGAGANDDYPFEISGATPKTLTTSIQGAIQKQLEITANLSAGIAAGATITANVDAAVARVQTRTATLEGAIQNVITAEATLEAAIQDSFTRTANLDAGIALRITLTAGVDAALLSLETRSANLQGAVQKLIQAQTNLEAAVLDSFTRTANLDAAVAKGATRIVTLEAALLAQRINTTSLQAAVQNMITAQTGLEAAVQQTFTRTANLDASIIASIQMAFPSSDITLGGWTPSVAGSPTELWPMIDEMTPDDADFIQSELTPLNDTSEVRLQALGDPAVSTGHVVRYRYSKDVDAGQVDLTVKLMDGATEIASFTHTDISTTWVQADQTLSAAEADAITDYANLRLRFTADQP